MARLSPLAFVFAVLIGSVTSTVSAQQPAGTISGIITDPSGAVIVGATATAASLATGATRTATSNEQGFFLIPTLIPGVYKLTVSSRGFADFVAEKVAVEVGQTTRVDAALNVGASREQIEVTVAAEAGVDTSQATVGGVVTSRQINQLPLNGRNYLELARLQPGVEIQEGRAFDPTKTRYTGISVSGRQGREARITIDGIDAVDEHVGTTTINISQDTIQEFQLSLSSADASTGLGATGAVNIITRRGSNELHGSGFIFGRSSAFSARPSFAATAPDFDREQFGGSAGGPVIKDKLFFFAGYEQTNEDSAIGISTPFFPALTSYPAPFDEKSFNARADWRLPRQNDFFFRFSFNDNSNFGGFGGNTLPSSGNVNTNRTYQYAGGLDTPLSTRLTNGLRAAFTDFKNRVIRPPEAAQLLAVPGAENYRLMTSDNSLISGPDVNTPQSTFERFVQIRDDVVYVAGSHTMRAGGDIVYRKVQVTNFVAGFPTLTINTPASRTPAALLNTTIVNFTLGNRNGKRIPGTSDNSHRNTRFSFYGEDSWRVRSNLTLNYGARYEIDTHPLNNDLDKPALTRTILSRGTEPTPIDKNNVAPHFGLAWDPSGDGKTSVRAGAGIYYAMRISNLVTNERASLAPFNSGNDIIALTSGQDGRVDFNRDGTIDFDFTPALQPGVTVSQALPIISAGQAVYVAAPSIPTPTLDVTRTGTILNNKLATPYSMQVNFGVQRELPLHSVIDVNVIYSRTVHEFMRDIDAANLFPGNGRPILLGDGTLPNRAITVVRSDGFSRYRALTARWDKRFEKRYELTASYAWARFETTSTDGLGLGGTGNGFVVVNRNVQANFGPGALDRTHRLTVSGIADLPKGLRVSLISTWSSGLPVSPLVGSADLNGDGINGDLLPGTKRGALGRQVTSVADLNTLIRNYNLIYAGKPLPRGGSAPLVLEVPDTVSFGDSFISHDLQLSKVFAIKERVKIEATAQIFNLFNISNLVGSQGLPGSAFNGVLTTTPISAQFTLRPDGSVRNAAGNRALAGVDLASSFGSLGTTRPSIPTGTGLPRAAQFGLRVSF